MNYKKINIENYLIYRQRHLNYFVRNNSLNNTIDSSNNSNFLDLLRQNLNIKNKNNKIFSRNISNRSILTTTELSSYNKRKEYNDNIYKKFKEKIFIKKVKLIQNNFRKFLRKKKNMKIIIIQKIFIGYLIRKKTHLLIIQQNLIKKIFKYIYKEIYNNNNKFFLNVKNYIKEKEKKKKLIEYFNLNNYNLKGIKTFPRIYSEINKFNIKKYFFNKFYNKFYKIEKKDNIFLDSFFNVKQISKNQIINKNEEKKEIEKYKLYINNKIKYNKSYFITKIIYKNINNSLNNLNHNIFKYKIFILFLTTFLNKKLKKIFLSILNSNNILIDYKKSKSLNFLDESNNNLNDNNYKNIKANNSDLFSENLIEILNNNKNDKEIFMNPFEKFK
jgi:hypothetical protein